MHAAVKLDPLTSLRFFAAAMIVLAHSDSQFGSMGLANIFSLAQGVSFFFVLSGFILTYNYPTLSTLSEIGAFFKARFVRIWPAHVAALCLLVLLTSDFNLGGLSSREAVFAGIANLFLIQSLIPLRDVFLTFNGVAWSLSTEMFFYLAFPLLITSILPGWKLKLSLILLIGILFIWFAVAWNIPADESLPQLNLMGLLYVNPLVRVFEFFSGVMACYFFIRLRATDSWQHAALHFFSIAELAIVGLALVSMWLTPHITTYLGWHSSWAMVVNYYLSKSGSFWVFALLIVVFAFGKGIISRAIARPSMVLLGEISFALYLVHTIVLKWYENNASYFSNKHPVVNVVSYWLLCLCIAWLLHKTIENPFRKLILSFPRINASEALCVLFGRRQIVNIFLAVAVLYPMKAAPIWLASHTCPAGVCELIVREAQLPEPARFGDYVSLLAIRPRASGNGNHVLDLVFKVRHPLPSGYRLAVHLVAANGAIVTQFDSQVLEDRLLKKGGLWLKQVQIPAQFITPDVARLGVAIYSDPKFPLPVAYTHTDYDGKRMLIDLSLLGLR